MFHLCFDDTRQVAIDEGQSSEMKDFQSHCRPSKASSTCMCEWKQVILMFSKQMFSTLFRVGYCMSLNLCRFDCPRIFEWLSETGSKRCQRDIQL